MFLKIHISLLSPRVILNISVGYNLLSVFEMMISNIYTMISDIQSRKHTWPISSQELESNLQATPEMGIDFLLRNLLRHGSSDVISNVHRDHKIAKSIVSLPVLNPTWDYPRVDIFGFLLSISVWLSLVNLVSLSIS